MPILLSHGVDTYSSTQQVTTWKKQFQKKYASEFPPEVFHYQNLNFRQFITDLPALPFLIEKKMVILKNFLAESTKEEQQIFQKNIETLPDTTVLIMHELKSADKRLSLYKYLKKSATVQEFSELSPYDLAKWLQKEIPTLSSPLTQLLINNCGTNLWTLKNECEKLKAYTNGSPITAEIISKVTTPHLSSTIFKLTDELGARQVKQALKTFHTLIESGDAPQMIFYTLISHFRKLLQIKSIEHLSPPAIKSKLDFHPFYIQKLQQQVRNFSSDQLKKIHQQFLKTDKELKSSIIKTSTNDQKELLLAIEKIILENFNIANNNPSR